MRAGQREEEKARSRNMVRADWVSGEVTTGKSSPSKRVAEGPVKTGIGIPALLRYKCLCLSLSPDFGEGHHTHTCSGRGIYLAEITEAGLLCPEDQESKAPGNERYWEEGGLSWSVAMEA